MTAGVGGAADLSALVLRGIAWAILLAGVALIARGTRTTA